LLRRHKKGLKKMQVNNAKAIKALVKPEEVNKHRIPKGANHKL
jgi:hypothetical protein